MKNTYLIIVIFCWFSQLLEAQYFNNDYGRPDPVLEFCYDKVLEYKDHYAQ